MVTLAEGKETLQLVCFWVGGKLFALEMSQVKEIIIISKVYPLPKAKSYAVGLIYHREKIFPLLSLRSRLGLDDFASVGKAVTIILEVEGETLGILVDQVFKVITLERDRIKTAPSKAFGLKGDYLWGIGELEQQQVLCLKIDKLMSSTEKILLSP